MSSSAPVWLFTGPEIGERNTAVEKLCADLTKRCGTVDLHTLYATDVRLGDVIGLLQNGSLFSDARFIVLRNAELIKKKDDIALIAEWVKGAASVSDVCFVLVSEDIGVDKKLEALVPKDHKRIFWEMFEDRKEQWIIGFFRKAGYDIESEAVAVILELVENNTDALRSACSPFFLFFAPGYRITAEDTENILAHNREETPFTLFDTLTKGDLAGSIEIYRKLSLSKDSSPVQLIAGLSFCFRRLCDWHRLAYNGETSDVSLKKAGFTSKRAVTQYRNAARRWDSEAASRIVSLLVATDMQLRSGGNTLQNCLMETCLYAIVKKNGQPLEFAEYSS